MSAANALSGFESVAVDAAHAGGAVLAARFRAADLRVETKAPKDYVTEVDRAAEAAVLAVIRSRCPAHGVMAEEGSPDQHRSEFRWIVDPLDGTTNFIHGVAVFAVSVALEGPEGLLAGCVFDPCHGETFHARRGGGARLNGAPIRTSRPASMQESLIATGFPFRDVSRLEEYLRAFRRFVKGTSGLRRAGSASLDLAHTACGRYDGFWEIGLSPWDIAAGALLVAEAGGTVTDVTGGGDFLGTGTIVAGGPELHGAMLEITRAELGGRPAS